MDNKKRILIVHSTLHIGGAEEVTATLCRTIDRSRYDVRVCVLKENGIIGEKIQRNGVPVYDVSNRADGKPDYLTFLRLHSAIRQHRIQLVHSHDVHALADASLCKLTKPGLKTVHTFHFGNYRYRDRQSRRIEGMFWRVPNRLISVANRQQSDLRAVFGIPEGRISTLWNGVDFEPLPCGVEQIARYRNEGRIVIGSINTLIEQKGMFDLIDVANALRRSTERKHVFLIAGDGHLRGDLVKEVERRGLADSVVFLGWVKDAARVMMPYIDIFFQPSLWEAMSMVLLEAMAAGRAILATGVGETPEILEEGATGYVQQPKDIAGMSAALGTLVEDAGLRERLGAAAKARYLDAFTGRQMAQRYERLYRDLLA